jgi:lipopolysaccharide/colanic/teichoic acid biosynthesis glycosyltransferase
MIKRLVDLLGAGAALVLLSPLLVITALLIKREDGGPMLYSGVRAGKNGVPFKMHKLRTMVPDAERVGSSSTAADDPRLTRTGKSLRRYKIDEIPQLFNVLRGEMSLVGPRPQVLWDVARYTVDARAILSVKPGVTDWASIAFANEGEILRASGMDSDSAYDTLIRPHKIRLELEYVRRHSTLVDMEILTRTALAIVAPRWAARGLAHGGQLRQQTA